MKWFAVSSINPRHGYAGRSEIWIGNPTITNMGGAPAEEALEPVESEGAEKEDDDKEEGADHGEGGGR